MAESAVGLWAPEHSASLEENFGDGCAMTRTVGTVALATETLLGGRQVVNLAHSSVEKDVPETDELTVGFRVRVHGSTEGSAYDLIQFLDIAGGVIANVRLTGTDALQFRRGTEVLASGGVLPSNAYAYLQVSIRVHDSTGAFRVRLGGSTVMSADNVDTKNTAGGNITRIRLTGAGAGDLASRAVRLTDFYCVPTFDSFQGPLTVTYHEPVYTISADAATSGSGDAHEMVDDVLADGDATYNTYSADGDTNLYQYDDPEITGPVRMVALFTTAKLPESGSAQIAHTLSLDTEYEGDPVDAGDTVYRTSGTAWLTDPSTDAAWDASTVSGLIAGPRLKNP